MRIIGIDPGYERMGVAVIKKGGTGDGEALATGKDAVLFSTCIRTSPKQSMPERLSSLGQELDAIIRKYKPDTAAIEQLYFAKNTTTALLVAEARGVIQYIIASNGLACYDYHPNTIKIAITGHGAAKKEDISFMIPRLVAFDTDKKID